MNVSSPGSFYFILSGIALVVFTSGCASSSVRAPSQLVAYRASAQNPIHNVNVIIGDGVENNIKFDVQRMQKLIEIALGNVGLYEENKATLFPELNVEVTKIRIRSSFNAVMWGAMAGSDSIHGEVIIRDQSGKVLDRFVVKASYALGGLAGGQDGMRTDWLYEAFAKEIVKEFTKK